MQRSHVYTHLSLWVKFVPGINFGGLQPQPNVYTAIVSPAAQPRRHRGFIAVGTCPLRPLSESCGSTPGCFLKLALLCFPVSPGAGRAEAGIATAHAVPSGQDRSPSCGVQEAASLWAPCIITSLHLPLAIPGSLAGPSLTPAPLFYLDVSSDPPARGDSARLVCIAPRAYVESEFWLLKMDLAQPVQTLFASEAQHQVTFILGNVTGKDAGQYRCRYRRYNESAWQMSKFSNVVEIAMAVNARRQQLKRDRESCWTERNFPTTGLC
ncbi:protein HIDE1 isoform X2 [Terrapene carolina triunguis]|uniref:protein HIDE1 isoform X2 n=1 Tax=Terrapene triunguis TaxID=2587831 RepID=UPI0011565F52|nr:protein HIDE1 isoform X2 [Terrapene carolina triunguis]